MARLAPPVAVVRAAVRAALSQPGRRTAGLSQARGLSERGSAGAVLPPSGPLVLVACSGGADSLALAAAVSFVGPRLGMRVGLITVDHGLQEGSAERATAVAGWAKKLDFHPVEVATVAVNGRARGPEAAARQARYAALIRTARHHRAESVLLGHTRDDQAETVLLALARGSGPRGIAGMPASRTVNGVALMRPFLDVSRSDTRAACLELGLTPWDDPHNIDPAYARSRVRAALPELVGALGPGLVANLARTAGLVAADNAVLDDLAAAAYDRIASPDGSLPVADLAALPDALRARVLRAYALRQGASGSDLSHRHVAALDAFVTAWHGQGPAALPGGRRVGRQDGRLRLL